MPGEQDLERLSKLDEMLNKAKSKSSPVEITSDPTTCRVILEQMIDALRGPELKPPSREIALAVTKLQEARFWLAESMFSAPPPRRD